MSAQPSDERGRFGPEDAEPPLFSDSTRCLLAVAGYVCFVLLLLVFATMIR